MFETIYKEPVISLIDNLKGFPDQQKGEFVIILSSPQIDDDNIEILPINEALKITLANLPLNQSVKIISSIYKKNKKEVYNQALELKNEWINY